MNFDIIQATKPIIIGRCIALPYCAINVVISVQHGVAAAIATNLFFLHIVIDMVEVFTLNRKLMRTPKESLAFQRVKALYNAFQATIWAAFLGSAVATFFVHPLISLVMLALHYARIRGEYNMWRIVNEDFIQRMKKRLEARRSSSARRGVRVPSMAGA